MLTLQMGQRGSHLSSHVEGWPQCWGDRMHFIQGDMCYKLPRWLRGKESARQCWRSRFEPWVRNIPWRGKCQPTPVFLPGESHGQRSLAGYSPWGCKESYTTGRLGTGVCYKLGWTRHYSRQKDALDTCDAVPNFPFLHPDQAHLWPHLCL